MALQHGCCGSTLVAQGGLHVCIEFMCVHGLPSTGIVPDVDVRACVHALSPDGMQASDSGVLGMHVCRCLNISKYCLGGTKVSLQDHHEAAQEGLLSKTCPDEGGGSDRPRFTAAPRAHTAHARESS